MPEKTKKIFGLIDVELYYNNEGKSNSRNCLCAVGEYNEADDLCQEWDEGVFYWFESYEEIERFKLKDDGKGTPPQNHEDFTVITYTKRKWSDE